MSDASPEIPQHIAAQAQVTRNLFNDPKTHIPLLKLIHEQNPNLRLEPLEQLNRVQEALAPALKRVEEAETRLIKREAELANRETRSELVDRGIVSREHFPDVEKFQTERGIRDLGDAAKLWAANQQAAMPRVAPSPTFNAPGDKSLIANHKLWARQKAYEVMNEFGSRR